MTQNLQETVGANIKRVREGKGMSQAELAWLMGTDGAYVSRVERGQVNVSIGQMGKFADALFVDVKDLLPGG